MGLVDGEILAPKSRIPEFLAESDDGRCTNGAILYGFEYIGYDWGVCDRGDGECDLCSEKVIVNACWSRERRRNVVGTNIVSVVALRALHCAAGNKNSHSRTLLRDLVHCTVQESRNIEEPTVRTTRSYGCRDTSMA